MVSRGDENPTFTRAVAGDIVVMLGAGTEVKPILRRVARSPDGMGNRPGRGEAGCW